MKHYLGWLWSLGKLKQRVQGNWQSSNHTGQLFWKKMWTGVGVKRPGQKLSSNTHDLTLVYRLFWGCSLPVPSEWSSCSQWDDLLTESRDLCLSAVAPSAPVALRAASSPCLSSLGMEDAKHWESLTFMLLAWRHQVGWPTIWIPWTWGGSWIQGLQF